MKLSLPTLLTSAAFGLLLIVAFLFLIENPSQTRAAAGQLPATVATSSNPTVGTTAVTLFATSSCAARIITTAANPIMLTFSDYAGQTPTGSFGHLQAASTTVVYDSAVYGCGLYKVYGYTGNTTITVTETR